MMPTLRTRTICSTRAFFVFAFSLLAGCTTPMTGVESDVAMNIDSKSFDEGGNRVPTTDTLHSLARILASRGNDPQCELVLLHLISQHPTYAPAYNELAELRLRRDRPAEALAALECGLKAVPRDRVLLNNRGMLHVLQEDYPEAVQSFDHALKMRPDDVQLQSNRALALGLMGREEDAWAAYLTVFSPSRALHNIAVIREARGDAEETERHDALAGQVGSAAP